MRTLCGHPIFIIISPERFFYPACKTTSTYTVCGVGGGGGDLIGLPFVIDNDKKTFYAAPETYRMFQNLADYFRTFPECFMNLPECFGNMFEYKLRLNDLIQILNKISFIHKISFMKIQNIFRTRA